jgi:hypothetical protein
MRRTGFIEQLEWFWSAQTRHGEQPLWVGHLYCPPIYPCLLQRETNVSLKTRVEKEFFMILRISLVSVSVIESINLLFQSESSYR